MDITSLPLTNLGWGAVVVIIVMAIIRGDLVPRKVHVEALAERDRWRTIAETVSAQNTQLLAGARVSMHAMTSVAERAAGVSDQQQEQT